MSDLGVRELYNVAKRVNTWGVEGYNVDRKYEDPREQIRLRELANKKKGMKDMRYFTKRGNYIDQINKTIKNNPGPGSYKQQKFWIQKSKKVAHSAKHKKTYIDQIADKQKKYKEPGVGQYNLQKTSKEIQKEIQNMRTKKINQGENKTYLDQVEVIAIANPGPGNYNPHDHVKKMRYNKRKPQDWRKIATDDSIKCKKIKPNPDVGSYHPIPCEYDLFQKNLQNQKKLPKRQYFGKQTRFDLQPKKNKSKSGRQLPGPGQYDLVSKWYQKNSQGKRKGNILTKQSHINSKSVYYQ